MSRFDLLRTQVTLVGLGWISGGLTCLVLFADDALNRSCRDGVLRNWRSLRSRLSRRSDVRIGPLQRRGWLRE